MPALTRTYETFTKPGAIIAYKIAASTTIYKGALVGINTSGFAVPMSHTVASLKFVGIAEETVVNSGANGETSIRVLKQGTATYVDLGSASQADLGKEVYTNTDNEVQIPATGLTNAYKVGTVVGLENTSTGTAGIRIRIDNYTV